MVESVYIETLEGKRSIMLRSALKRNLFPIALITLGCVIFLALILYLFQAHLAIVGWVIFGLLMIAAGVIGIAASRPKPENLAGHEPISSHVPPGTPPPSITSPKYSTTTAKGFTPRQQGATILSRPALIGGGVLLVSLVLLLLCNLGTAVRSLLTVHETQIVDCREAPRYAKDGWRFTTTYSYTLRDAVSGDTVHTDCVMEQERLIWTKNKRTPKDDVPIDKADTDIFDPTPYWEPTQTSFRQPPATQMPLPSPTVWPVNSPLPTETPLPSAASLPTDTPFPIPPATTPISRTDIDVCAAASDDTYLNMYVQWEGVIKDDPTDKEDGRWFRASWTSTNPDSVCSDAAFFVSYNGSGRFLAEDAVIVTGTIINTNYEYEGESGQTEYAVVIRADKIELVE